MAFNTLTIGANTFNSIGGSQYRLSTVPFGGLEDDIRLARGTTNKLGFTTAAITRRVGYNHTVGDIVTPRVISVTLSFTLPPGATAAMAATATGNINTWSTEANLSRLFLGES